jgi:hypothetical protein
VEWEGASDRWGYISVKEVYALKYASPEPIATLSSEQNITGSPWNSKTQDNQTSLIINRTESITFKVSYPEAMDYIEFYWVEGDVRYIYYNTNYSSFTWSSLSNTVGNKTVWARAYENGGYTPTITWSVKVVYNSTTPIVEYANDTIEGNKEFTLRFQAPEVTSVVGYLVYNNTSYSVTGYLENNYWKLTKTLLVNCNASYNESKPFYWNYTVVGDYGSYDESTNAYYQLVHRINIANGTPSWIDASTLRFEFYDEATNANVTASMQATFSISNTEKTITRVFGFNESNKRNFTFYIYPNWASYICDAQILYSATGYSPRTHYLSQATINNQTQVVKLMLANSSATTKIDIYVKEPNSIEAPNVVIQIQKYDVGTATYTTVQTVQTDYAGHAIAYLQLDQWYRFIFIRSGKVVKSTDPIQLTTNSYTFYLDFEGVEPYQYYGKFAYSVEYLTATRTLRVIASDTSGLMQSVTLKIDRKYPLNYTNIYDHTESGSSVTMLYTFPNETATYSYSAVANFQSTKLALGSGIIEVNPAGAQLGTTGLLMAAFTIMTLGLIGIWSPSACVALSTLGVIVSYWLGLIAVTFSAVVGLVASAAILIYKLKD